MPSSHRLRGLLLGLTAALFFGASIPASKAFGHGLNFLMVTALLYFGSGAGLALAILVRRFAGGGWGRGIARGDWPLLAVSGLLGGGIAPAFLMWGLARSSGIAGSLLNCFESAFTALIAWLFFREKIDRLAALALALIVGGGLLVAWSSAEGGGSSTLLGLASVTAAYLGWSLDNNLTRKLAHNDPLLTACLRGLVCGTLLFLLARFGGDAPLPEVKTCLQLGLTGALGYGVSLTCLILAMRSLGAARAGAAFGASPFFGALCALFFFGERGSWPMAGAAVLMAAGLAILGWESLRKRD